MKWKRILTEIANRNSKRKPSLAQNDVTVLLSIIDELRGEKVIKDIKESVTLFESDKF